MSLFKLRNAIRNRNLDAFIQFHSDAHRSEYLAPCDQRIKFVSGFTGSNGIAVSTHDKAYLYTDSRYYLQAQNELMQGWEMKKMEASEQTYFEFLKEHLPVGAQIGVDESLITASNFEERQKFFK